MILHHGGLTAEVLWKTLGHVLEKPAVRTDHFRNAMQSPAIAQGKSLKLRNHCRICYLGHSHEFPSLGQWGLSGPGTTAMTAVVEEAEMAVGNLDEFGILDLGLWACDLF